LYEDAQSRNFPIKPGIVDAINQSHFDAFGRPTIRRST